MTAQQANNEDLVGILDIEAHDDHAFIDESRETIVARDCRLGRADLHKERVLDGLVPAIIQSLYPREPNSIREPMSRVHSSNLCAVKSKPSC